jgi:hypothetical protein
MSGGSLNYLYSKVEDAAVKISAHYSRAGHPDEGPATYGAQGMAFVKLLFQVSKALKDIEWDMSGDGSDWKNVAKLIGPKEEAAAIAEHLAGLLISAEEILKKLNEVTDRKRSL